MISSQLFDRYKRKAFDKIRTEGFSHFLWLASKRLFNFKMLIVYPAVFVLCIIIKLIKPLFFIRFGTLHAEKIGPMAAQPELNLCEQEHGIQPRKTNTFNIYNTGGSSFVCNKQMFVMWKRILRVYPRSRFFWKVMNAFSFGKDHIIQPTKGSRDIHGLLEKTPVHLFFTKEEISQAKKDLLKH